MKRTEFTTIEAKEITGLTEPMLHYLARSEIYNPDVAAKPRGRGVWRIYGLKDLLILRIIHELLESGISVKRQYACLREIRKKTNRQLRRHNLIVVNESNVHLTNELKHSHLTGSVSIVLNLLELHQFVDSQIEAVLLRRSPKRAGKSMSRAKEGNGRL